MVHVHFLFQLRPRMGKVSKVSRTVKCETCGITLNSEQQAQQHYSGKTHLKKLRQSTGQTGKFKWNICGDNFLFSFDDFNRHLITCTIHMCVLGSKNSRSVWTKLITLCAYTSTSVYFMYPCTVKTCSEDQLYKKHVHIKTTFVSVTISILCIHSHAWYRTI